MFKGSGQQGLGGQFPEVPWVLQLIRNSLEGATWDPAQTWGLRFRILVAAILGFQGRACTEETPTVLQVPSRKLTWKPEKGPIKTTAL